VQLHYDPIATTCRPVMLFVHEHDLPIELVLTEIMAGETRTETFLAINPNGAVPVLVDGDFALTECSAILKYLADVAGSPTYPAEQRARARVNAVMDWFNTGVYRDLGVHYAYPKIFPEGFAALPSTLAEMAASGVAHASKHLTVLDRHMLGEAPYVCGADVSLADYLGAVYVGLGVAAGFDLAPWPNVAAWLARMGRRSAWDEANAAFAGFLASRRQLAAIG